MAACSRLTVDLDGEGWSEHDRDPAAELRQLRALGQRLRGARANDRDHRAVRAKRDEADSVLHAVQLSLAACPLWEHAQNTAAREHGNRLMQ